MQVKWNSIVLTTTTLIYLQVSVQIAMSIYYMRTKFTSNNIIRNMFEWLESFNKFCSLSRLAFTTKEKRHISKKDRPASKTKNRQPFSEYFSVRTLIMLILWFLYVCWVMKGEPKSTTSIIRVFKYDYDDFM